MKLAAILSIVALVAACPVASADEAAAAGQAAPRHARFGLEQRIPWTASRIVGSPDPPPKYVLERAFPSLSFSEPAEMAALPGSDRLIVVEVKGKLFSFANRPQATDLKADLFADLTTLHSDFFRVYGITFHPRFAENRWCYVCYVLKAGTPEGTRVSRFKVTATDPPRLDLASEEIVITWVSGGHNGGHMKFGPDGYLYISAGDGGDSFPPDGRNTGQDIGDLLASMLRIDVDRPAPGKRYSIPADNPFVGREGARGEVWAYGLRNPWKICFDPADGSLWVGDVGWEMWELVYRIERGGNYGWSLVEGRQPVHRERQPGPTPILPPTVAHDHTEARSITGGYFYQGSRLPELRGAYIYGDYVTGKVWGLRHDGAKITWHEELLDTPLQIVTFGLDQHGEIHLVDYGGTIHRLAANPRTEANADFPRKLSETGLFASVKEHQPAPGVIPYSINAEPWADGTTAERFVALPGETKLGVFKKTDVQIGYIAGEWEFPQDGVLAKTVSIELEPGRAASRRRLETQVLQYDAGFWRAYNYVWNDDQTDATLLAAGLDRTLSIADPAAPGGKRQQTWHHASRVECLLCHTTRAGSIHGFRLPQLARTHDYGGTLADQLETLDHLGLFAEPLPGERIAWPDPHDASADLAARARAYLHVNCGHCHRRGGGGSSFFDVQYQFPLAKTSLLGTRPTQGTFGIHSAEIVAPGDPYRSVVLYRMAKLGPGRMPQFGSQVVDERGIKLIHDWIASLPAADSATPAAQIDPLHGGLHSPADALRLVVRIDSAGLSSAERQAAIDRGLASEDATIRDLFERWLPEEKRIKRLGTAVDPAELLALPGDAARGQALFRAGAGVQCRNCHRCQDQGTALGPDLTQIGRKLSKDKLLESLLEPSRTIDPQYVSHLVETTDGRVLSGLLIKRDESEIVLRDAQNKEVRIPADQVHRSAPQQKSLMPDLLLRDLTAPQVADLLEFLSNLK